MHPLRGSSWAAVGTILILIVACTATPASEPSGAAPSAPESAGAPPSGATETAGSPDDPMATCADVEPDGEVVEIPIQAQSIAFDTELIEGPSHCQPFVIELTNLDEPSAEITEYEHNIFIRLDNVLGSLVFEGETVGTGTIRYEVPGLPAGTHYFYCSLHSGVMSGDLIVADAGS
jgi:hypothetical protein